MSVELVTTNVVSQEETSKVTQPATYNEFTLKDSDIVVVNIVESNLSNVKMDYLEYKRLKALDIRIDIIRKFGDEIVNLEHPFSLFKNVKDLNTYTTTSPSSTTTNYSSTGYNNYNNNYSGTGTYTSRALLKEAFKVEIPLAKKKETRTITFFGSAKEELRSVDFTERDLVINLTGVKYIVTPPLAFVMSCPTFLDSLKNYVSKTKKEVEPQNQLVLDWKDMQAPPSHIDEDFFIDLYDLIVDANIERVYVCCQAGMGRTGTTLAGLYSIAKNVSTSEAIKYIKTKYYHSAIETQDQIKFLLTWDDSIPSTELSKIAADLKNYKETK